MPGAILNSEPFEGNSVTAYIDELTGAYVIKSYNTVILEKIPGQPVIFNNKRYSVTTSKLQNLIINTLGLSDSKKR